MIRWITVKSKIDCGMFQFCFFILQLQQGNSSFNDPEYKQAAYQEWPFFPRVVVPVLKNIDNTIPHDQELI